MAQVKVIITREGEIKMEVVGANGPSCLPFTRELEVALNGGREIEREFKPEFEAAREGETESTQESQQQTLEQGQSF